MFNNPDPRTDYKILLLGCLQLNLHGPAPGYLEELLVQNQPWMTLGSASENKLVVSRASLKTYWEGTFCYGAPKLWNSLPRYLRLRESVVTLKAAVKTFLFKWAFK